MKKRPCLYIILTISVLSLFHHLIPFACGDEAMPDLQQDGQLAVKDVEGIEDEFAFIHTEQSVTVASKVEEKVKDAPSIVTVITAEEIENLGARTLTDILRTVPGFDIQKQGAFGRVFITARGQPMADKKIKVLIDGHSLNQFFDGGTAYFFDDLPLKNVKRIEIVRGPGSAIYGANAFSAVVNIITKNALDVDGADVAIGFGSYDTQEYSILSGKRLGEVSVTGFGDFYNTNGLNAVIEEDRFSGQPFSNTPGRMDDSRNRLDTYLNLSYKDVTLNAGYINKDVEHSIGSNYVLTDDGENFFNFVMADLSYKWDIGERLTVKPRVYYDQYDIEFLLNPFPDGFTRQSDVDGDGDIETFPDGVISDLITTDRRLGSEIQMDYELFENNVFTLGSSYEWERQDNVESFTNSDPTTGASLGAIQDMPDKPWIKEAIRQIWAIYIQDRWDITDTIGLTIGIRHDHYSDFEGTTNPRIGLTWDFIDDATLKVLYGQAFRAPGFTELFLTNNPTAMGNPDLKPETVRTYEVGLDYRFTERLNASFNYFFNAIRDEIVLIPLAEPAGSRRFENTSGSNTPGVEFELKADLARRTYAFANYTYQDAESRGDPINDVPKHKGNVGINVGLWKYLNANLHTFVSGKRPRTEADQRDDSPGYAVLNLTLIAKEFFKDMQVKASLFNLLDKDYSDPAPAGTVPNDTPRPGRTFFIGLEYGW